MSKARPASPTSQHPPTRVDRQPAQAFGGYAAHELAIQDGYVGRELKGEGDRIYRIIKPVGEGGMAKIYMAQDIYTNEKVAVKFLHSQENVVGDDVKARFLREAQALSKVRHKNVVEVRYVDRMDDRIENGKKVDGEIYVVMELLEGMDLHELLKRFERENKTFDDWARAKPILLQICEALQAVHMADILHRDLKPSNIMIMKKGNELVVKVLDFGLVKFTGEADDDGHHTKTRLFLGTPKYASPEQAMGMKAKTPERDGYDHRVDIYALGVIMYHMLCGYVPFEGETHQETLMNIVQMKPMRPSIRNPKANIPPDIEKIVMKALEKNPENRFQSMAEMMEAIKKDGKTDSVSDFRFGDALGTRGLRLPRVGDVRFGGVEEEHEDRPGLGTRQISSQMPRKQRRWGRRLVTLGLLAGMATAGYHYRDYLLERWQQLYAYGKEKIESIEASREANARTEAPGPYTLSVNSNPPGAIVYVQERIGTRVVERRLGRTGNGFSSILPPGQHTIVVRGSRRSVTVDVTEANRMINVDLTRP